MIMNTLPEPDNLTKPFSGTEKELYSQADR